MKNTKFRLKLPTLKLQPLNETRKSFKMKKNPLIMFLLRGRWGEIVAGVRLRKGIKDKRMNGTENDEKRNPSLS